jgi:DNA processing protein
MEIKTWFKKDWPKELREIPHPPKKMRIRGEIPDNNLRRLCVVGPRKHSNYADNVCRKLISDLKGYPISIVSGLAYGIDSLAHRVALDNNIHCIAVPGSGLQDEVIYPQNHLSLAHKILKNNGCLISEYADNFHTNKKAFPQRNRIMTGISHATLMIEAAESSGTMISARLTLDYNKDLMTIPGSIFNLTAQGANRMIKEGAIVVRNSEDILEVLGIKPRVIQE